MNITVVGTGYVGLTVGVCFAEMGNNVICLDINEDKIKSLQNAKATIFEPGLESLLKKNINHTITFTSNFKKALEKAEVIFLAVGTPMKNDGNVELKFVDQVAKEVGLNLNTDTIVVNKSTVPVGTAKRVEKIISRELNKRDKRIKFWVVSNPEFLKEGSAINDFMKPDRVVIGAEDENVFKKMEQLYSPFFRTHDRFIRMDVLSAEMTKYAANAMLATKISFINEIAIICEKVGADVNKVRLGVGSDSRIGYNFLYPGAGYGGSCFPKDIKALDFIAKEHGYETKLISSIAAVNDQQKKVITNKIYNRFKSIKDKTFAIWGLAFKPGTDDIREAPSIYIIKELIKQGAKIHAYDPKAIEATKKEIKENITFFDSKYEALIKADALILMTEWKEFRSPDFAEIKKSLSFPIIFDGRNQYNAFNLVEQGFEYYQIGKK